MRHLFLRLSALVDRATRALCMSAVGLLVVTMLTIVVLRYGFGTGSIWLQNFATYSFAVFIILAVPVCMARDGHVRVEVLSERLSPGDRRGADAVATLLFLIPVFGLVIWAYWPNVMYSLSTLEGSSETGGLPGRFIVRSCVVVGAALMIVQGIAAVLRQASEAAE